MTTRLSPTSHGDLWRKYDLIERRLSASLSERMIELAKIQPGMRVLDVATGRGDPAIPAAHRVLPEGAVVGVDVDESVLQLARERAECEGLKNLSLVVGNIEYVNRILQGPFDVAFARWGLMYLQRPVKALKAIQRLLAAGGLLVIAVWIDPEHASFFQLPRESLSRISPLPEADHNEPGAFYYSEMDKLCSDLDLAEFRVQHTEDIEVDVMEFRSNAELVDWARDFGMSRLLKDVPAETEMSWERELVAAAETFRDSYGLIRLGGTSRIVVAKRM